MIVLRSASAGLVHVRVTWPLPAVAVAARDIARRQVVDRQRRSTAIRARLGVFVPVQALIDAVTEYVAPGGAGMFVADATE